MREFAYFIFWSRVYRGGKYEATPTFADKTKYGASNRQNRSDIGQNKRLLHQTESISSS